MEREVRREKLTMCELMNCTSTRTDSATTDEGLGMVQELTRRAGQTHPQKLNPSSGKSEPSSYFQLAMPVRLVSSGMNILPSKAATKYVDVKSTSFILPKMNDDNNLSWSFFFGGTRNFFSGSKIDVPPERPI